LQGVQKTDLFGESSSSGDEHDQEADNTDEIVGPRLYADPDEEEGMSWREFIRQGCDILPLTSLPSLKEQ
jgi:hypothetical protein